MPTSEDSIKPLTYADILRITEDELKKGRSKQQVLESLRRPGHSDEYLAQTISKVPDPQLRLKYGVLNRVLFVSLAVTAALHLLIPLLMRRSTNTGRGGSLNVVVILLMVSFAPQIRRMRGGAYMPVGLACLAATLQAVAYVPYSPRWALLSLAASGTTSILSFYVGGHLFPHRGLTGIKKDEAGNWML